MKTTITTLLTILLLSSSALAEDTFVLNEDGLGGLVAGTKVTKENLEKIFPNLTVKENTYSSEGYSYSNYEIFDGKKLVAQVYPDDQGEVYSVSVLDDSVQGPQGVTVGADYKDVAKLGKLKCYHGVEGEYSLAYCEVEGIEKPRFVLDMDGAHRLDECFDEPLNKVCVEGKRVVKLHWYK